MPPDLLRIARALVMVTRSEPSNHQTFPRRVIWNGDRKAPVSNDNSFGR
jgi:hypothetical protein